MRSLWSLQWLAVAVATTGCTRSAPRPPITTGENQIGPETFAISVRADRAVGGVVGAEREALKESNNHCRASASEILVLNRALERGLYRVSFRCLKLGDADLQRPRVETPPNRIIQQRQR